MTDDEHRLLCFFRCLAPADQFDLICNAGKKAVFRCLPTKSVRDFLPNIRGVDPYDKPNGIFNIIHDGVESLGDPETYVLGTDNYDDTEAIPRFVSGMNSEADRQGSLYIYDNAFAREFLREWRLIIAQACYRVASGMAKSVIEAESQQLDVPQSVKKWIDYVLTLDGDRICDELDMPSPGMHDVDLGNIAAFQKSKDSQVEFQQRDSESLKLDVRLALYQKLRYLQVNDDLPPSDEELEEIQNVLDFLRNLVSDRRGGSSV